MAPLPIFNPPEPAGNPEFSAGTWFDKRGGLCGTCQSCPGHWELTVEVSADGPLPVEYSGKHILYRRIPDPPQQDAFCVWLSQPSNALSDAGLGDQLAGASLWRLAYDPPRPPNSTSPYWWEGRWAIHAGAFYWPLTVGIPDYLAGSQLDVDPEEIGGYASFIRSEWETRPFRCLHPNPFDLVEQSAETGQFPATLLIEPWWP